MPSAVILSEMRGLARNGAKIGHRTLGAIYAVSPRHGEMFLKESGTQALTFYKSFLGDPEGLAKDKQDTEVIWMPKTDPAATLLSAYEIAEGFPEAHGAIRAVGTDAVGIRAPRDSDTAVQLRMKITGQESGSGRKWKVVGIHNRWATKL